MKHILVLPTLFLLMACSAPNGQETRDASADIVSPLPAPHARAHSSTIANTAKTAPAVTKDEGQSMTADMLVGRWKIAKLHSGGVNDWTENDPAIIGKTIIFERAGDTILLRWGQPDDVAFNQSERCDGLTLSEAKPALPADVSAIMEKARATWKQTDNGSLRLIACQSGRWGPAADNGYYSAVQLVGQNLLLQGYNGDVYLLNKLP